MEPSILASLSEVQDGSYVVDINQRITFWNQAAERILGYDENEAVGKRCPEILGGHSKGRSLSVSNCYGIQWARLGKIPPSHSVLAHPKHGESKWISITLLPLTDVSHEQSTLVHLFHEVTAEMEALARIQQMRDLLYGDLKKTASIETTGPGNDDDMSTLTPRELEILHLLSRGLGTKEIAKELVISTATVRNHIEHVLAKLHAHTRLEAVVDATRHGLI